MGQVSTTELVARVGGGFSRGSVNYWSRKLGVKPSGETKGETGTTLYLWPDDAVRKIRAAWSKRQKKSPRRGGKETPQ